MTATVLALVLVFAFALLVLERVLLDRRCSAIPLRIAVTGTRGKSSVTRMLASVLRESGRTVIAKTTGSKAVIILPDGLEKEVKRRGRPSIMEQKQFVHLGANLGADTVVAEIMSVHAENHFVEAQQLLKPHVVLATNFRVDHTAAMGNTREGVASVISLDVPSGSRVFVPEHECLPAFREAMRENGAELVEVPAETATGYEVRDTDFPENLHLVFAAARSLGLDDEMILKGIRHARQDIGALQIWRYELPGLKNACVAVNAFAANDPESTLLVQRQVMTGLGDDAGQCIGLMNLRADRGDRTIQWAEALADGALREFSRLYLCGLHAPALARRLPRNGVPIEVLRRTRPQEVMKAILSRDQDRRSVVFGFGNIGGLGEALVEHWNTHGEPLTA